MQKKFKIVKIKFTENFTVNLKFSGIFMIKIKKVGKIDQEVRKKVFTEKRILFKVNIGAVSLTLGSSTEKKPSLSIPLYYLQPYFV